MSLPGWVRAYLDAEASLSRPVQVSQWGELGENFAVRPTGLEVQYYGLGQYGELGEGVGGGGQRPVNVRDAATWKQFQYPMAGFHGVCISSGGERSGAGWDNIGAWTILIG